MNSNFVLTPSQRKLVCSTAKYRHVIGGIRSGMSTGIMYLTALVAEAFMNNRILIGRYSWPVLRDTSLPAFREMLRMLDIDYEYKAPEQTIKLDNGTVVMFRYLNDYNHAMGLELGMFVIEHLDEIPVEIYNKLRTRLNKANFEPSRRFHGSAFQKIFGTSWERLSITSSHGGTPKWIRDRWYTNPEPSCEAIQFTHGETNEYLPEGYFDDLDFNPEMTKKYITSVWE